MTCFKNHLLTSVSNNGFQCNGPLLFRQLMVLCLETGVILADLKQRKIKHGSEHTCKLVKTVC